MLAKLHFNISNPHRCISHQRCTRVCIVFSSACDIVSGAFLIPSRPSSVVRRLSSSTFFSNRIGPSVVIRSCRYLAWMCITMLGKNLSNYNFAFMLLIFYGFLITKNWEFWSFGAIGSLSCHPIFPIFGLNVHNNIAHKIVRPEFWFLPRPVLDSGYCISKSCLFASLLRLWNISKTRGKRMETESVPHPKWLCTNMFAQRVV